MQAYLTICKFSAVKSVYVYAQLCFHRIQTERQERKRVKQEMGIVDDPSHKTRFDPPEPVASGVSLGIKPAPAGMSFNIICMHSHVHCAPKISEIQ